LAATRQIGHLFCHLLHRQSAAVPGNRRRTQGHRNAWSRLPDWRTGRYVIMSDHVHFFASPVDRDANLSKFVQAFRSLVTRQLRPLGFPYPLWQREFFDHLLRRGESYETKWQYV
jgi:REP element-mobilizing transposase RayT